MPWAVEEGGCEIMVTIDTTHCEGVLRSDEVWFPKKGERGVSESMDS